MRCCTIEGCDREHYARDYCRPHYMRWWHTGYPLPETASHRTRVTRWRTAG